ncbi:MAG: hypothetical protein IT555_20795 [Acetobacteraceae bacterium]|nr:hypothetical protein [Acetobacteraceae bacterium]
MVDGAGLRAALARLLPAGASRFRSFTVGDATGRLRIGTLCTDAGWYAEVSNFVAPAQGGRADYCAAWAGCEGIWRFNCEVDLFYSDIEQTMAGSRRAAEAALAAAGGSAG